jgi:hypothetical protein
VVLALDPPLEPSVRAGITIELVLSALDGPGRRGCRATSASCSTSTVRGACSLPTSEGSTSTSS